MKPMLTLVFFGFLLLGITFIIANNHFEGVVEEKTYEAALKYDETTDKIKKLTTAFKDIKISNKDNLTTINFLFNPISTSYPNTYVKQVKIIQPAGKKEYIFTQEDNGIYIIKEKIQQGLYNLNIICDVNSENVTISQSIYID